MEHYLYRSTGAQLTRVVKENLLRAHVVAILEKGFDDLMDAARLDDLGRMYQLLALVDGLPQLRLAFSLYMKRVGSALVGDTERDHLLVQELLNLKEKLDGILEKSFEANEQLTNTLKEGFEHFINLRQNKPAELVARFIDGKLRSGNKGCSEEELEETLDKAMTLFRYIDGKDMFEAFYKKDLSKRLLLGKSASIDAEKSIISKLKAECGSGFTSKLEGMFKDVELSRDVMSSFRNSSHAQTLASREAGELSVHVLTQGYWPTYPPVEINLPSEILELQQASRATHFSHMSHPTFPISHLLICFFRKCTWGTCARRSSATRCAACSGSSATRSSGSTTLATGAHSSACSSGTSRMSSPTLGPRRTPHPFLPYVAPHFSHISHFNPVFLARRGALPRVRRQQPHDAGGGAERDCTRGARGESRRRRSRQGTSQVPP